MAMVHSTSLEIFTVLLLCILSVNSDQDNWSEACLLQPDPGPCYGYFEQWYYDSTSNQCKLFGWGGCQGNKNRFDTQADCESKCKDQSENSNAWYDESTTAHKRAVDTPCKRTLRDNPDVTPNCDEQGYFKPLQCKGSNCWCVNQDGVKLSGVDCDQPCFKLVKKAFSPILVHGAPLQVSSDVPECDEEGYFLPKQCKKASGECWCVDKLGREIKDTRTKGERGC